MIDEPAPVGTSRRVEKGAPLTIGGTMQYSTDGRLLSVYGPNKGKPIPRPGDPGYLPHAVRQVGTPSGHSPGQTSGPVNVNRGSW